MEKLTVVKIGGKVIDSEDQLATILADFSKIKGHKILIHGGGTMASEFGKKLGIEPKMVEGRRVTDAASLDIVTMIYAGLINKKIVAALQSHNCNAIGLSGADGNSIKAHKRIVKDLDYGFVGDIDEVNSTMLATLLKSGMAPVFSAITHDNNGQLLNTNADTIASTVASAMSTEFEVKLIITFELDGVLTDPDDKTSVIPTITHNEFEKLKADKVISHGMIPKLTNGFDAIDNGVKDVIITSFANIAKTNYIHTKLVK
ncbi:MAG: acetylglutamate kinase [Bacteroidota bacterium]